MSTVEAKVMAMLLRDGADVALLREAPLVSAWLQGEAHAAEHDGPVESLALSVAALLREGSE